MAQACVTETGSGGTGTDNGGPARLPRLWNGLRRNPRIWRRGLVLAVLALILALVMALHARIPNSVGNTGSLTETFLPWLGVFVPVLLVLALVRRSATGVIAVLLPAMVWLDLFGGLLTHKAGGGGGLTVLTHNVNADNPDPSGTARDMAASGADVVALEELPEAALPVYEKTMRSTYQYHEVVGTIGLWSRYPMSDTKAVDIKLGWQRALRSTVTSPEGKVAVYVAHLPSVRVKLEAGFTARQRDKSADALGKAIEDESALPTVLLGDLNGTMNDRALNAITAHMRSTQGAAGAGFGFSWPASFPMARIDQILVKGAEPTASWTLPETGSDHLPIAARVRLAR
jgi:vancomycin resistance protein VanJ